MIRLQELTPEIYYKQSRDFQFIGRLYDIVLNYVKTNTDSLYNLPIGDDMNESLLNLLSYTLGFKSSRNYNSKQLLAICSVLPEIIRHKGSLQAIITAVNALLGAEGTKQSLDYEIVPKQSITLYLDQNLSDLSLLRDLLTYILPAGMSCSFVKEISERFPIETEIEIDSKVITSTIEVNDEAQQFINSLLSMPNTEMYRATITSEVSTELANVLLELKEKKSWAKVELAAYKSPSLYRKSQQEALTAAIENGKSAIDNSTTLAEVENALSNAKEVIDAIKTDEELTAEENENIATEETEE